MLTKEERNCHKKENPDQKPGESVGILTNNNSYYMCRILLIEGRQYLFLRFCSVSYFDS